jgi:leucyl aminopeptidase
VAEGVALARDLVNTPGGELTPAVLASVAKEIAEAENLKLTIMKEKDIARAGLGGLLGVNRGSTHPPRLIELSYEPTKARGSIAFVGKGITFDSGGLSLKTADGMMTMKDDMGGAAAILGAFSVISSVAPPCKVRGYIPATDNMPGGDATRPGDVLKIRNGKTVEVLNTDAEGRLVLADALSLASEAQPDAIVDLATLTGAVEVALGSRIAGLMGNDADWVGQVRAAAADAGERVWELPLPADYHKALESEVADLRNVAKNRGAGSIIAGLFLQEFVGAGIPWAHLDIAGTAWLADGPDGELTTGGTGWGVRTILELTSGFRGARTGATDG